MTDEAAARPDTESATPAAVLQHHINWYLQYGYRVVSQTETSAQLVKIVQPNDLDEGIYLTVASDGTVTRIVQPNEEEKDQHDRDVQLQAWLASAFMIVVTLAIVLPQCS